jgi:DNA-binding SARP family transcriptional activator
MIACRLLGPLEVTVDGAPAPSALLWRKHLALLVYLVRSPKRARTRQHLIGLLWSDKPEARARASLNEALRIVRRCAGRGAVKTRADQVSLDARAIALDTDAFEARSGARDWAGAAQLAAGEFLEGFGVPGASEFETWLAAERDHWRRRAVDALVQWAAELLGRGEARAATDAGSRALGLDPTSGAAVRVVMRSLAVVGDRAAALSAFEQFAAALARDFGARPDAETEALAGRVRRERVWSGPRPAPEEPPSDSRRAPLVGRSLELKRLLKVWNECREERRAAALFVEGDIGAGKTRLGDEVAARARLDGAVVAAVRAVEGDLDEPGHALLGLARGGLLDAPGLAAAPPAALAAFAARADEWADHFPAARRVAAEPSLGAAFTAVLRALTAEQPAVLLVDDAQWADAESLLALGQAARDLPRAPLALVITTTPRPLRPELEALRARVRRDLLGVTVRLAPLGPDDLRELSRWALPWYTDTELDRLTRRVGTDSAGLPLLAVELLHAVALGLDLKSARVAWPAPTRSLIDSLPGDLPDSVVGAIRIGYRRLNELAQRVLAAAAVLGDRVAPAALERATGLTDPELTAALDDLEYRRWLTFEPRGYSFVARIVRQVVERDMVLPGQRDRILRASHRDHSA